MSQTDLKRISDKRSKKKRRDIFLTFKIELVQDLVNRFHDLIDCLLCQTALAVEAVQAVHVFYNGQFSGVAFKLAVHIQFVGKVKVALRVDEGAVCEERIQASEILHGGIEGRRFAVLHAQGVKRLRAARKLGLLGNI